MGQRRPSRENQLEIFGLVLRDWAESSSSVSVTCALLGGFPSDAHGRESREILEFTRERERSCRGMAGTGAALSQGVWAAGWLFQRAGRQ